MLLRPSTPPRPPRPATVSPSLTDGPGASPNPISTQTHPVAALTVAVPEPALPPPARLHSPAPTAPPSTPATEFAHGERMHMRTPGSPQMPRHHHSTSNLRAESRMKYQTPDPSILLRPYPSPGVESELGVGTTAPTTPVTEKAAVHVGGVSEIQSLQVSKGFGASFPNNLMGPTTTITVGRGHGQTTFTIHQKILSPTSNPTLSPGVQATAQHASATPLLFSKPIQSPLDEILTVKDADPTTFASVLEFLYNGDYMPTLPLLLLVRVSPSSLPASLYTPSKPLFTVQALLNHLRIGVLARKQNLDRLVRLVKEKLRVTVNMLDSPSILEVVRVVYADGYAFRDEFFRLMAHSEEKEHVNNSEKLRNGILMNGGDKGKNAADAFWTADVFEKVMDVEYDAREEFMELVERGGVLARDVCMAMWKVKMD